MMQAMLRCALIVLCALICAGCTWIPNFDAEFPLVADVLHDDQANSVTWLSRTEILMSRQQLENMRIGLGEGGMPAFRIDRPIRLDLVAVGGGAGRAHDWAVLRVTPQLGVIGVLPPVDPTFEPRAGDFVVIFTLYPDAVSKVRSRGRVAIGRIHGVYKAVPSVDLSPSAGDLFEVDMKQGPTGAGWSGSPACVWDRAQRRWVFLGVLVADEENSTGGRFTTILRPPTWVFDLLTPDEPKVTWPGEAR